MKKLLAVALLALSQTSFAGSADEQFGADLAHITRVAQDARREPSLWDPGTWFQPEPEPVASRVPDPAEARRDPASQQVVEVNGTLYFIDGGHVFRTVPGSGRAAFVRSSEEVVALVAYKGALVALQRDGDVYLLGEDGRWIDIGDRSLRLAAAGDDLVALGRDHRLYTYRGQPGSLRITFILIPHVSRIGNSTITTFTTIPVINGRRVAFDDTGIGGVAELRRRRGGGLDVVRQDGTTADYAALRGAP